MSTKKKTPEQVAKKASICLKDREDIPSAPLWHMAKAAKFDSAPSFELIQNTIDYLSCKAKAGRLFSEDEKEFLVELYEALWWGGSYAGLPEAAKLANHYVNGDGKDVKLNPSLYQNSVIVQDAIVCLKNHISNLQNMGKVFAIVNTTDIDFQRSKFADPIRYGKRNQDTQGHMVPNDGALMAEQNNTRLHYSDNRFHLKATTSYTRGVFFTQWSVDSLYDFADFNDKKEGGNTTIVPVGGKRLKIPDGLSNHMEKIGIAKRFWYRVEWHEHWKVK